MLGNDDVPVAPIEGYLAHLTAIERSPNTVKAYAHDLKDYFIFLDHHALDWREVRLEDVGEFVAWLRLPAAARAGLVAALPSVQPAVSAVMVNRKLAAVGAFYLHHARHGVDVGDFLVAWKPGGRGSFKPFLQHQQRPVADPAGDLAAGCGETAPGADRRRGPDDPGCVHSVARPVAVRSAV